MPKRITITFPADQSPDFYNRVFWFGEALYGPIVRGQLGSLCDVDKARGVIWLELANSHDVGEGKAIVRKLLAKFDLTADGVVAIT